jgi:hypothetical protein
MQRKRVLIVEDGGGEVCQALIGYEDEGYVWRSRIGSLAQVKAEAWRWCSGLGTSPYFVVHYASGSVRYEGEGFKDLTPV